MYWGDVVLRNVVGNCRRITDLNFADDAVISAETIEVLAVALGVAKRGIGAAWIASLILNQDRKVQACSVTFLVTTYVVFRET